MNQRESGKQIDPLWRYYKSNQSTDITLYSICWP
jgi:hypothetical protein